MLMAIWLPDGVEATEGFTICHQPAHRQASL